MYAFYLQGIVRMAYDHPGQAGSKVEQWIRAAATRYEEHRHIPIPFVVAHRVRLGGDG
jgi:hypothetical protein